MEDTSKGEGATIYLMQGVNIPLYISTIKKIIILKYKKTDLVWGSVVITSAQYRQLDYYPHVCIISPFGLLIPITSPSKDFFSIWEPIQPSVTQLITSYMK